MPPMRPMSLGAGAGSGVRRVMAKENSSGREARRFMSAMVSDMVVSGGKELSESMRLEV